VNCASGGLIMLILGVSSLQAAEVSPQAPIGQRIPDARALFRIAMRDSLIVENLSGTGS
jgi:hypothetical protein